MNHKILVKAAFQTFTYLAPGSAFFHGSETDVGQAADSKMNDLFTYVLHQAAVSTLDPGNTLIQELSYTQRENNAFQYAEDLKDMFLNDEVVSWEATERAMDIPPIEVGMCGIVATVGSMSMTNEEIIGIAEYAVNNLTM